MTVIARNGDDAGDHAIISFTGPTIRKEEAWVRLEMGDGLPTMSLTIVKSSEGVGLYLHVTGLEGEDPVGAIEARYAELAEDE